METQTDKQTKPTLELKVYIIVPKDIDTSKMEVKLNKTSADKFIEANPNFTYVRLKANKL